jgi:hypothetical protein
MKFTTSIFCINKRGQKYNSRPTKNANGISKHYGGRVPDKMLKMAVHGTFDKLARTRFDFIWITVTHPTDISYTKKVRILSRNKRKFLNKMPVEDIKKFIYKLKS